MALPQFRYLWARLSPLAHPAVLASGLFALLAGAFALEFGRNPNWYRAYDADLEESANGDLVSSDLTPEEQAQVANIDNLAFLTNTIGNESAEPGTSLQGQQEPLTLLQQLLASSSSTVSDRPADSEESTLNRYLDRYAALELDSIDPSTNIYRSIFESASSGATGANPNFSQLATQGQTPAQGNGSESSPLINSNPLAQALQALIPGLTGTPASDSQASDGAGETNSGLGALTADGTNTTVDPFGLNGSLRPVTLPGIPGTFLPTTPAMSPPLGTTGYTPPASLPLIPPLNTNLSNAYTNFPNIPGGAGVPAAANSNLDLTIPSVNNGLTSPLSTTVPASPSRNSSTLAPSPFAVQGIPGSYTGGGYINTFSNPGQAPSQ
ncbi:MAG: hypothetical protein O3A14_09755 [Cyanobacteria bacterium]|nr:hypothetical protein [Cyanobacteriota bacterium]